MVTPYINSNKIKDNENQINKMLNNFYEILTYLDNFGVKQYFGEVALKVLKEGCYYGYIIENNNKINIQDLPANYCRSRYKVNGRPAVEFNMKFFDDYYKDTSLKMRVLNLFPKEFAKGYKQTVWVVRRIRKTFLEKIDRMASSIDAITLLRASYNIPVRLCISS